MPSGGGHVGLWSASSLPDLRDSEALCERNASTREAGGAIPRLRSARSAPVSTDDKAVNLEMSL